MDRNRENKSIKNLPKRFFRTLAVKRRAIILGFIIFISGVLFYEIFIYRDVVGTTLRSDEENAIREVNKLLDLDDEDPTVATIVEIETLKEQNPDFYQKARNGDKLIIYQNAILIYRPSSKKVINFAKI